MMKKMIPTHCSSNTDKPTPLNRSHLQVALRGAIALCIAAQTATGWAQATTAPAPPAELRQPASSNPNWQRYEVNQTFRGRFFVKDQNVWAYDAKFAETFGMPTAGIDAVSGISAAAFRIEKPHGLECGYGGIEAACKTRELCVLDLYFDESINKLPWATETNSYWLPMNASAYWLRAQDPKEKPRGLLAMESPTWVIINQTVRGPIMPFVDPISKYQSIFLTNANVDVPSGADSSGSLAVMGFTRNIYRELSVVSLQFGCSVPARKTINIWLESKLSGIFDPPIAVHQRVTLPERFVSAITTAIKTNSDNNTAYYKSILTAPRGTASKPAN